jgi:hypothetical protein
MPERPSQRRILAMGGGGFTKPGSLLFEDGALRECVASREGARVVAVRGDGAGGVDEVDLPVRVLSEVEHGRHASKDLSAVSELRALRAARRRWEE